MTEIKDIPFRPGVESGWDPLAGAAAAAVNVIIDGKGAVRRRPGIQAYEKATSAAIGSGEQIIGLASVKDDTELLAWSGELNGPLTLYRVKDDAAVEIDKDTADFRPFSTETEAIVAWTAGRSISKIYLEDFSTGKLQGGPPIASHVVYQATRLLANNTADNKIQVSYSAPQLGSSSIAGHEQWGNETTALGSSGSFTAESRSDPVVAIHDNSNEVFVWSTSNFQTFAPDPGLVYAPVSTRENGCFARSSIIRDDQSFAWFDHRRRFVHSDGRTVSILSDPIQKTLDDMVTVDDCFGYRVTHGPLDALVWTFPADCRTFCYQKGGGWSLWMGWDPSTSNYGVVPITAHAHVRGSNVNVVGTNDGKIGMIKQGVFTDLGKEIPAYVQTGSINRDTSLRKQCVGVRLTLRRGATTSPTDEPVARLQWRDDEGAWQSPIEVSLGKAGDLETVVSFRGLGVYRTRAWRFSFHGTSEDIVLARAEEEYEMLTI